MWVIWWILPSSTAQCRWFTAWNIQLPAWHLLAVSKSPQNQQVRTQIHDLPLQTWSPSRIPCNEWMDHPSGFTSQKPRGHPCCFFLPSDIQSTTRLSLLTSVRLQHRMTQVLPPHLFHYGGLPTHLATSTPAPVNMSSILQLQGLFLKRHNSPISLLLKTFNFPPVYCKIKTKLYSTAQALLAPASSHTWPDSFQASWLLFWYPILAKSPHRKPTHPLSDTSPFPAHLVNSYSHHRRQLS